MQQALKELEKAIEQQRQLVFDTKLLPKDDLDSSTVNAIESREADVRIGVSNSFGFGGHNATVVIRRFED